MFGWRVRVLNICSTRSPETDRSPRLLAIEVVWIHILFNPHIMSFALRKKLRLATAPFPHGVLVVAFFNSVLVISSSADSDHYSLKTLKTENTAAGRVADRTEPISSSKDDLSILGASIWILMILCRWNASAIQSKLAILPFESKTWMFWQIGVSLSLSSTKSDALFRCTSTTHTSLLRCQQQFHGSQRFVMCTQ